MAGCWFYFLVEVVGFIQQSLSTLMVFVLFADGRWLFRAFSPFSFGCV